MRLSYAFLFGCLLFGSLVCASGCGGKSSGTDKTELEIRNGVFAWAYVLLERSPGSALGVGS